MLQRFLPPMSNLTCIFLHLHPLTFKTCFPFQPFSAQNGAATGIYQRNGTTLLGMNVSSWRPSMWRGLQCGGGVGTQQAWIWCSENLFTKGQDLVHILVFYDVDANNPLDINWAMWRCQSHLTLDSTSLNKTAHWITPLLRRTHKQTSCSTDMIIARVHEQSRHLPYMAMTYMYIYRHLPYMTMTYMYIYMCVIVTPL